MGLPELDIGRSGRLATRGIEKTTSSGVATGRVGFNAPRETLPCSVAGYSPTPFSQCTPAAAAATVSVHPFPHQDLSVATAAAEAALQHLLQLQQSSPTPSDGLNPVIRDLQAALQNPAEPSTAAAVAAIAALSAALAAQQQQEQQQRQQLSAALERAAAVEQQKQQEGLREAFKAADKQRTEAQQKLMAGALQGTGMEALQVREGCVCVWGGLCGCVWVWVWVWEKGGGRPAGH